MGAVHLSTFCVFEHTSLWLHDTLVRMESQERRMQDASPLLWYISPQISLLSCSIHFTFLVSFLNQPFSPVPPPILISLSSYLLLFPSVDPGAIALLSKTTFLSIITSSETLLPNLFSSSNTALSNLILSHHQKMNHQEQRRDRLLSNVLSVHTSA